MAHVKLSTHAQTDLEDIWSYIAEDNVTSADKVVDELLQKFQLLAKSSGLGKKRDDLMLDLRGFPHKRYMIFYFVIDEGIEIFRVIHGSRDIDTVFDDMVPSEEIH